MVAQIKTIEMDVTDVKPIDWQAKATQLFKEYVSGGYYFQGTAARALGVTTDDVSREVNNKIYDEMLKDPDVAAAYWHLVYSVLADELTLSATVHDKKALDYEFAQEIVEFCRFNLTTLETPIGEVLEQMMEFMKYGHKKAEKIWKLSDYNGELKVVLDKLKVKEQNAVLFVVDAFMNVLGFLPTRSNNPNGFNNGLSNYTSYASVDPDALLGRDKFFVLTFRSKDSDPRGNSLFRAAYNGWNFKRQIWGEWLLWLMNCAVPQKVGYTAENADDEIARDAEGNKIQEDGQYLRVSAEEAMLYSLESTRNGYASVFPFGSKVDSHEVNGIGEPFEKAIDKGGAEITQAMLLQSLATKEGKHQARASSQIQMTIVDILIKGIKTIVCSGVKRDLLYSMVEINYGTAVADRYTPDASLGDTERRDWSVDASALAQLASSLTPSQLTFVLNQLGIPEPEEGETETMGQKQAAANPLNLLNNPVDKTNPIPPKTKGTKGDKTQEEK